MFLLFVCEIDWSRHVLLFWFAITLDVVRVFYNHMDLKIWSRSGDRNANDKHWTHNEVFHLISSKSRFWRLYFCAFQSRSLPPFLPIGSPDNQSYQSETYLIPINKKKKTQFNNANTINKRVHRRNQNKTRKINGCFIFFSACRARGIEFRVNRKTGKCTIGSETESTHTHTTVFYNNPYKKTNLQKHDCGYTISENDLPFGSTDFHSEFTSKADACTHLIRMAGRLSVLAAESFG